MTKQQQRKVCAELALRMGWVEVVFACSPPIGIPPPGEQDFATVSDPFTYADDNRALVVWIARRDEETRHCFEVEVENKIAPYGGFGVLAVLITPLETITLAAASRPRGRGVMESALTAIDGLPLVSRNKKKAASTLSHSQPYIEFDSASRS